MPKPVKLPPGPHLVGDHLALDFLNSRVGPGPEQVDWLANGTGFLAWLVAAGAIDAAVARRFHGARSASGALEATTAQARGLRDWLHDFVERHARKEIDQKAVGELAPLNRLLARDDSFRLVEGAGAEAGAPALRWRQARRWTNPEQLLMPIAEAIGDLVCTADFRLVRACEGANCILMFYDRTKAHRRRWCSMDLCGNRAKAATHRARKRRLAPLERS
jgi:predicted RNA-binding Zn ribbon-like protein